MLKIISLSSARAKGHQILFGWVVNIRRPSAMFVISLTKLSTFCLTQRLNFQSPSFPYISAMPLIGPTAYIHDWISFLTTAASFRGEKRKKEISYLHLSSSLTLFPIYVSRIQDRLLAVKRLLYFNLLCLFWAYISQ